VFTNKELENIEKTFENDFKVRDIPYFPVLTDLRKISKYIFGKGFVEEDEVFVHLIELLMVDEKDLKDELQNVWARSDGMASDRAAVRHFFNKSMYRHAYNLWFLRKRQARPKSNIEDKYSVDGYVESLVSIAWVRKHASKIEVETLDELLKGGSKSDVARRLGIKKETIQYRVYRLQTTLGVKEHPTAIGTKKQDTLMTTILEWLKEQDLIKYKGEVSMSRLYKVAKHIYWRLTKNTSKSSKSWINILFDAYAKSFEDPCVFMETSEPSQTISTVSEPLSKPNEEIEIVNTPSREDAWNKVETWMRKQRKSNGESYSEKTIGRVTSHIYNRLIKGSPPSKANALNELFSRYCKENS